MDEVLQRSGLYKKWHKNVFLEANREGDYYTTAHNKAESFVNQKTNNDSHVHCWILNTICEKPIRKLNIWRLNVTQRGQIVGNWKTDFLQMVIKYTLTDSSSSPDLPAMNTLGFRVVRHNVHIVFEYNKSGLITPPPRTLAHFSWIVHIITRSWIHSVFKFCTKRPKSPLRNV